MLGANGFLEMHLEVLNKGNDVDEQVPVFHWRSRYLENINLMSDPVTVIEK